jgi:tetratricopeptide (TPR) repeat protein
MRARHLAILLAAVAAGAALVLVVNKRQATPPPAATAQTVPLYTDLGKHAYRVTTTNAQAQAYFDQGLRLYYAFNHAEAVRAFREAQRLDSACAMCWWGEALAWGPNINLPMDSASGVAAYAALQGALERRAGASPIERALIDALAVRYEAQPPADRARLDQAYASAMRDVARRFPDNHEVTVLHGESLMDVRPWDYWTEEGEPQPGIAEALAGFERVIAANPNHPGACHFFIHAVEKVYPQRAVPCAERLASLMPGAGHLVHMPGHIYIRVGRYQDAVEANRHAIHADETYIRDQNPASGMYTAGYYPHNYDFLAFASLMIGRGADAIAAADKVGSLIPAEMFGTPGMSFLEHWSTRGLQVRVRFGRWDELLAMPQPPESQPHARAMSHYARGRAFAAKGNVADARKELAQLTAIRNRPELEGVKLEFNQARDVLAIAEKVLAGSIESAAGRHDAAVAALREAVRLEDALLYGEPPEWTVPVRQDFGAVLLAAGKANEAERVFREDLAKFPANGWSLRGLAQAVRRQGRNPEADSVDVEFKKVWSTADVEPMI